MSIRASQVATCLWLSVWGLFGCVKAPRLSDPYCAPPNPSFVHFEVDPLPAPTRSREEQLAALLGLLTVFRAGHHERSPEQRLLVLERLEAARLSIAATSAELECESERLRQAADFLTGRESRRAQSLTVSSIAVAAAAGVTSVLLSTAEAPRATQNAVGITGSILTTGLGVATLLVDPKLYLTHPRNLLADVWNGPEVAIHFPPLVWAYLTLPVFSNAQDDAIRNKVVARWRTLLPLDHDRVAEARFFGRGGSYDVHSLRVHAAMLDHVNAEVALENQELRALAVLLLR
jgi:hypothetical protein